MNRYRCLHVGRGEVSGFGVLFRLAEQERAAGRRGDWPVFGVVAADQAGAGGRELLGVLEIGADGVELREIEPAEAG